jgi:predicted transcriptional regulator
MKVKDLAAKTEFEVITLPDGERDIDGVYIGDLLSWVMGRADSGNAWVTIMSNINILAVASLSDTSCIILAEGVTVDDEVIKTALDKEINILTTKMDIYSTAVYLNGIL